MNVDLIHLKNLWQQAFGDSDAALDAFFSTGFSPDRYNCILEDSVPVSALYWFDCTLAGQKFAYLYAIATEKSHQGQGLCRCLVEDTHRILKTQGCAGAVLVPAEAELFDLYEKLGYRAAATVREFACQAAEPPIPLTQIDARQYAALRQMYLPNGGLEQAVPALDFYATYGQFYEGADFLLACCVQDGVLRAQEILGNTAACGNILCTLGVQTGTFRAPGKGKVFAMYYPLQSDCPAPDYLGFALD